MTSLHRKVRAPDLTLWKARGERIVMLTAYDATMARLLDRAGVDVLLVGDSLGQVILGLDSTIPVTLDAVIHHTRAVVRGASRSLVVADMPFLTYQISTEEALRNAMRLFQDGGAAAVKLEGGRAVAGTVRRLTESGLPVMGHVGLTPQHIHRLGGMRIQAREKEAAQELIRDALSLEDAGAFAVVLEAVPDDVAEAVTRRLKVPTIGIGAGPHCDGQVLVSYDLLGLFDSFVPSFVRQYARLGDSILSATKDFASDVRHGAYPPTTEARHECAAPQGPADSNSRRDAARNRNEPRADKNGHQIGETRMLWTFVNGKIHQLKVTGLQPAYNGSCLICPELLAVAGIEPFEKVEIYSLTSTARIATYVFPGAAKGEFTLNGGAALHFRLGDRVAVVAYRQEETFSGANCVIVDPSDNSIAETLRYETPSEVSTIAGSDGRRQPSPIELEGARYQGRHVAEIAAKLLDHKS